MRELIRCVLPALLLLATIQVPPDDYLPPIIQRLDPTFHGFDYRERDLFVTIENQGYLFWLNTGKLPETLLDTTDKISRRVSLLNRTGRRRQRIRVCRLNSVNKVSPSPMVSTLGCRIIYIFGPATRRTVQRYITDYFLT